jgi:membrane associated rhomboid family serine protease
MSGLVRCAAPGRALAAAAQLGNSCRFGPITASKSQSSSANKERSLWTDTVYSSSSGPRRTLMLNKKEIVNAESGRFSSLLPPLQMLRGLYHTGASSRGFSTSCSLTASKKTDPQDTDYNTVSPKVPSSKQSVPREWIDNYEEKYGKKSPKQDPMESTSRGPPLLEEQEKAYAEHRRLDSRAAMVRVGGLSHMWLLYWIVGINIAVLATWHYAFNSAQRYKDPGLYLWMDRNFLLSRPNLDAGRFWTILTSTFSHVGLDHIAMNMVSLMFMAPPILSLLGPASFSLLYLGAGLGAAVFSMEWRRYVNPWINRKRWNEQRQRFELQKGSLGASGECLCLTSVVLLLTHILNSLWLLPYRLNSRRSFNFCTVESSTNFPLILCPSCSSLGNCPSTLCMGSLQRNRPTRKRHRFSSSRWRCALWISLLAV